jgi:D-alanyl-D-alanine carboxypeptidase
MAAERLPTRFAKLWAQLGIPESYPRVRGLPLQREAKRLVSVGNAPGGAKRVRLTPRTAAAWRRMVAAAAEDGVTLLPLSGFRSVARQTQIVRGHLRNGRPLDDLLRYVAAPGCSEHHTGRAIDIGSPDEAAHFEASFARTREFRWLKRRAGQFGFHLSYPRDNPHAIGYEPWHWCWRERR